MAAQINRRDLPWVALIAISFTFGLAVSWQRWGNPLVDCGREMNQPLRLARGEMLYSDVRHIYGPLSPYLNATLYRTFGPSLTVLYVNGILTTVLIIILVYWLARQLMGRVPSAAATLSVIWLCTFKQAGNYFLPYSYSALHGCALGLVALALLVKAVNSGHWNRKMVSGDSNQLLKDCELIAAYCPDPQAGSPTAYLYLAAAGAVTGLTILAKTEMGLAALIAGFVAAGLIAYPKMARVLFMAGLFVLPAAALVVAVYAGIAARVGWATLSEDSFLFLQNVPPELVYFNKRMSGFDRPLQSLMQMVSAVIRVISFALIIASISLLIARRKKQSPDMQTIVADQPITDAGRASYPQLWVLLIASLLLFGLLPLGGQIQWEKGPYLAMPVLLAALIIVKLIQYQKEVAGKAGTNKQTLVLIVISVYALASLARMMLRVRSGGAYSSYLIPTSVILFTYWWHHPFANMIGDARARRLARNLVLGIIFVWIAATAMVLAYRYRAKNTYPIVTARGTIIAVPDLGKAFDEAIAFINRETAPTDSVAVFPEGVSLNFFTDRRNPLRDDITIPGMLDPEGEERAINRLTQSDTRLILITNRPTSEFGADVFGRDYSKRLMRWIEENFEQCAVFGPDHNPDLQIGDETFFIRAYRKKSEVGSRKSEVRN